MTSASGAVGATAPVVAWSVNGQCAAPRTPVQRGLRRHAGGSIMSEDYNAAADWAERDMTLPQKSTSARRGQAAAEFGRDLLSTAGGLAPLPEGQRPAATLEVRMTAAERRDLAD